MLKVAAITAFFFLAVGSAAHADGHILPDCQNDPTGECQLWANSKYIATRIFERCPGGGEPCEQIYRSDASELPFSLFLKLLEAQGDSVAEAARAAAALAFPPDSPALAD